MAMVAIAVADLAADLEPELVDEADALSPRAYERDCSHVIVVREGDAWSIVDGYHRVAGLAAWCRDEDEDPAGVTIAVLDATGCAPELIAAASEPGPRQAEAIRRIEAGQ
jgi:hypothetical protein